MIASSLKEGQEQQDGAEEIVDLLLNKGADVNIKSEFNPLTSPLPSPLPFFFPPSNPVCMCMGGGGIEEEFCEV